MNLKTTDVQVFPSTKRANKQVSARLMTEQAIVGIINKLVDRTGFVITLDENIKPTSPFEFNIFGYYFKIETLRAITELFKDMTNTEIYGNIALENSGEFKELYGQDDDDTMLYSGISFTDTPTSSTALSDKTYYNLLILKRDVSTVEGETIYSDWYVPSDSRVKFELDGGEI